MKLAKLNVKAYKYLKQFKYPMIVLSYYLTKYTCIISLSKVIVLHLDILHKAAFMPLTCINPE